MSQQLTFPLAQFKSFAHLAKPINGQPAPRVMGVYAIVQTRTGMAYIGSTENFFERFSKHFRELKGGYHGSLQLQAHYLVDPDAFEFRLLQEVDTTDGLMELEEQLSREWGIENLYNCCVGKRRIPGRYGLNASAPRAKTKGVRKQHKARWYDGQC